MEDSTFGSLTLGVTLCVESDIEVETTQLLHLNLKKIIEPIKPRKQIAPRVFAITRCHGVGEVPG